MEKSNPLLKSVSRGTWRRRRCREWGQKPTSGDNSPKSCWDYLVSNCQLQHCRLLWYVFCCQHKYEKKKICGIVPLCFRLKSFRLLSSLRIQMIMPKKFEVRDYCLRSVLDETILRVKTVCLCSIWKGPAQKMRYAKVSTGVIVIYLVSRAVYKWNDDYA